MAFGALADTGTAICMEKFMQNANADGTPKILYTGVAKISMSMRSQADKDSASLGLLKEGEAIQIFGYDQEWLFCWRSDVVVFDARSGRVAIFEAKYAQRLEKLTESCHDALRQMDERKYAQDFEDSYDQIFCYGIAFFKKRCLVQGK